MFSLKISIYIKIELCYYGGKLLGGKNMSDLVFKLYNGSTTVELHGNKDFVYKIFRELKEEGFGKLAPMLFTPPTYNQKLSETVKENLSADKVDETNDDVSMLEYPSISDVVIKNFPKSEVEWIVVYAFYISEYASQRVGREAIREMYRSTNRFTSSRSGNFVKNIETVVKNNWLSSVNEDEFVITDAGKSKVIEILSNKSNTPKKTVSSAKKNSASASYNPVDLGLSADQRSELNGFYNSYKGKAKSNIDKILVLLYWLKQNTSSLEFDADVVFTLLRTVNESTSFAIQAALGNMLSRNNYIRAGSSKGKYSLTHFGEDRVVHDLIDKE